MTNREIVWKPADILWIMPPFGLVEYPALGLHTLQAVAGAAGFSSSVFYSNQSFAARLGPTYAQFCGMNYFLLGERIFAKAAWGDRVPPAFPEGFDDYAAQFGHDMGPGRCDPVAWFPPQDAPTSEVLREAERIAGEWLDELAERFDNLPYAMVGVTNSFEHTNVAMALLQRIKQSNPHIVTLIGGFACEDDGAEGIASLDPDRQFLDYVFSGESEHTLTAFLKSFRAGQLPTDRILRGKPLLNLDEIPLLDFTDYFDQLGQWFPELAAHPEELTLVGETSRGCWWGEKSHCLFCGYEERLGYREKSPERILEELDALRKWNIRQISMADLIIPRRHFETLVPELIRRNDGWKFYYEQRAVWNRDQIDQLKRAGIVDLQPGLETLSDQLLAFMGKGTTLRQNLRFLRDATGAEVKLFWNIVWGFPGEKNQEYAAMNDLVPLIRHMTPPLGMFVVTLTKFSVFWRHPDRFGIRNLRLAPAYREVFPAETRVDLLGTLFAGDYEAETLADPTEILRLSENMKEWNQAWESFLFRPRLQVTPQPDGSWALVDTRGLTGNELKTVLTADQREVLRDDQAYTGSAAQLWALDRRAALRWRDRVVSLATIATEES